uniref:Helicase C-terminal domain-containing protein n=1 Tax=Arcella intermedia TaxID=1963864 RepID=A0A6B2LGD3_9EUKA
MLEREVVSLGEVRVLIVEEVSLLLDMGFEPQVRRIVGGVPHAGQRQTLMSTVAFPKEVELFAGDISSNCVKLGAKLAKTVNITQRVIQVEETQKKLKLIELLGTLEGFTLVFVERKKKVSEVYTYITENLGIPCAALHGDMSSSDRDVSIKLSSSGKVKVLIATDITSRGIDLPNIKNIVNYDMPPEIDDYVYRMGKTGREESGTVISFLNRSNINIAHHLIRLLEDSNEPVESFLHQYTNL